MSSRTSIYTLASVTVLGGLLAYVVYFDYKRRNDAEFRRKLRKEKKKANKTAARPQGGAVDADDLRAALAKVRTEELPATPEEKEQYFMTQVGMAEELAAQGPAFRLPAALSFYRALRVYPSPVELIMIYQKTVPEDIFKVIMDLTNMDVKDRVEGYYNIFPPKSMNVSVQDGKDKKKILVAEKDFEPGDVIYKEEPIVTALDLDIQAQDSHCAHCFRSIQKGMAIKADIDRLGAVYCSKDCQLKSKVQSENLLFGLDAVLPPELDSGISDLSKADREQAQGPFADYLKSKGKTGPILVARLVARAIAIETGKLLPKKSGPAATDLPLLVDDNADYSLYDHLERLRYIEVNPPGEENKLLTKVLAAAVPGLEQSITDERYAMYLGKVTYNAYGVCFGGGRDDKPVSSERPEDKERTRTPYGTSRQVGSGFYLVSSYIGHSCAPSARPSFSSGTAELHLIATRKLKKGDEITVSYVDVSQHDGEAPEEARRRRRFELAWGWRFRCECERCVSETMDSKDNKENDVGLEKDGSKVEDVVQRAEKGGPGGVQDPSQLLGPD